MNGERQVDNRDRGKTPALFVVLEELRDVMPEICVVLQMAGWSMSPLEREAFDDRREAVLKRVRKLVQ